MRKLFSRREFVLLVAIIIISVATTIINPQFLTIDNLINIASTNAATAIIAVGMTMAMIIGGIDISVSAQLVTVGVLCGKLMQMGYLNSFTMFVAFMVIGGCLGSINGILIAKTDLPPIIVTLATQNIFRGFILQWTRGSWMMGLPGYFLQIGKARFLGIPCSVYILAIVAFQHTCFYLIQELVEIFMLLAEIKTLPFVWALILSEHISLCSYSSGY